MFWCLYLALFATVTSCGRSIAQNSPDYHVLLAQCAQSLPAQLSTLTLYAEGTFTPANPKRPPGAVIIKVKGTDRIRADFNFPNATATNIVSGGRGQSVTNGKKVRNNQSAVDYFLPEYIPALACFRDKIFGLIPSYVESTVIRGTAVHHLRFDAHPASGKADRIEALSSEFHVFVDAATGQIVKTQQFVFAPEGVDNRSILETFYSDYRNVSGILVPFHITHVAAGQSLEEIRFSKVLIGIDIADTDFAQE
jgi:hypothetical protein